MAVGIWSLPAHSVLVSSSRRRHTRFDCDWSSDVCSSVLLCAIAVAMTARRYVHRHLDAVALLKTLGATRAFTLAMSVLQLLALALLAAVAGAALGFLAQEWLLRTIRGLLAVTDLPAASLSPLAIGFVTAIALLAGFALPPLLQLARVPALRVLRRDVGPPPPLVLLAFGPAIAVVLLLIYWVVPERKLFLSFTAALEIGRASCRERV